MPERSISSRSRRHFLLAMGVGGVAASVAGRSTLQQTPAAAAAKSKRRGYTVTPHIDKYYRTAKL